MSIFKESFKSEIRNQLEARQSAIEKRDFTAIRYLNSRTAWIKMTSSVNVGGTSDLARNYILQGGALNTDESLKSGVGKDATNAYSIKTGGNIDHRLGMRPMPGITGVEIKTKSAYGSLMEATVNFVCWDIKQLEELELLYMRPNYSVLLEWGWIPYLTGQKGSYGIGTTPSTNTTVITGGVTKEQLWKDLYNKSLSSGGNYNAIYGFVKNYSWSARPDGGYDCTTSIITMGEIIESLKVNWVPSTTDLAFKQGQFGKADSENFKTDGPLNKAYQRSYLAGLLYEIYIILKDVENIESKTYKSVTLGDTTCGFYCYEFKTSGGGTAAAPEGAKAESESFVSEPKNVYIKLINFIALLNKYCIMHAGKKGSESPIVQVSVTEGFQHSKEEKPLLCLGHPYQISMDPTICLINNPEFASSITATAAATATAVEATGGSSGETTEGAEDAGNTANEVISGFKGKDIFLTVGEDGSKFGVIGNIYVNLAYLYTLITDDNLASQDKKEKKDIALFDFLKNMMSGINSSIGNVANFDVHIDPTDSIARIIDINYVDEKTKEKAYENAFLLEMHNTKSTVRSYKLESQIFPEQSSVIAIGAQAKGGALGQGDNTLVDFNQNLEDRIVPKKDLPPAVQQSSEDEAKDITTKLENLKTNLTTIAEYFSSLDDGNAFTRFFGGGAEFDKNKASQYTNALKDIIVYVKTLTADKTNNRAIIPTTLSLEMDGIGGIIIGSIFKIPEELLPRGYKGGSVGAKIAFIVTKIGHSISDNDWKTKIDAQFIILDGKAGKSTVSIETAIKTQGKKVERVKKIIQRATPPDNNETPSPPEQPGEGTAEGGCIAVTPNTTSIAESELEVIAGTYKTNTGTISGLTIIDGKPIAKDIAKAVILLQRAFKKDIGTHLTLTSGFRPPYDGIKGVSTKGKPFSATNQATLYKNNGGPGPTNPITAKPGTSQHGNGIACDFGTIGTVTGQKGFPPLNKKYYQWMICNAHKYGFIRTVAKEEWHWEYRPGQSQFSKVPKNNKLYNGMNVDCGCTGGTPPSTPPSSTGIEAILVGGLDYRSGDLNIDQQVATLGKGLGKDKAQIKGFRYNADINTIKNFISSNPNASIFLFSAGCDYADDIVKGVKNINKNKVYIIEPWAVGGNASVKAAVTAGVPAGNVYVGTGASVGEGVVVGTSKSGGKNHFDALRAVGKKIAG